MPRDMSRKTATAKSSPPAATGAEPRSAGGEFGEILRKPDWTRRWVMIRAILGFCAALTLFIVIAGPDDRLRETAFLGLLALAGSVALGYLGFATQDDRNWMDRLGGAGREELTRRAGERRV